MIARALARKRWSGALEPAEGEERWEVVETGRATARAAAGKVMWGGMEAVHATRSALSPGLVPDVAGERSCTESQSVQPLSASGLRLEM